MKIYLFKLTQLAPLVFLSLLLWLSNPAFATVCVVISGASPFVDYEEAFKDVPLLQKGAKLPELPAKFFTLGLLLIAS
jgi:hypothetical protein